MSKTVEQDDQWTKEEIDNWIEKTSEPTPTFDITEEDRIKLRKLGIL